MFAGWRVAVDASTTLTEDGLGPALETTNLTATRNNVAGRYSVPAPIRLISSSPGAPNE